MKTLRKLYVRFKQLECGMWGHGPLFLGDCIWCGKKKLMGTHDSK